jgi:hypothetical protein
MKTKYAGTGTPIPAQLGNLLRQAADADTDPYVLHEVPNYSSLETVQPPCADQTHANSYLTKCEAKARHELKCYLTCVYWKLNQAQG